MTTTTYRAGVAKRSYGQHCGLAVALDVVGERWALLIVRDLLPGPRRFGELFDGLHGISTDLLTARLRSLEEIGVVERRVVGRTKQYALTDEGEELRPIVELLALWGTRLLPEPESAEHRLDHRWALATMAAGYRGGLGDGEYGIDVGGDALTVEIAGGSARLVAGPPGDEPQLELRFATPAAFFGRASIAGRAGGSDDVEGHFFEAMPLPIIDSIARPESEELSR